MTMAVIGSILFSVLAMLVTLGILVTFHEYGHYRVARLCGVQVECFSIGFGRPLFSWKGKPDPRHPAAPPTEFVIRLIPLGGYVKMLGEQGQDEVDPALADGAFNRKPLMSRAAIIAAGPFANFLLAIVLYWLMFMTGVSGIAPVVGRVEVDSVAARAGLKARDEIVQVDGKATPSWQDVLIRLLDRLGESGNLTLTVTGADSTLQRTLVIPVTDWLRADESPDPIGYLGIVPFHQVLPARIGTLLPDGRALAAGLQSGDLLTRANGQTLRDWSDWLKVVHDHPEQDIQLEYERKGQIQQVTLRPGIRMTKEGLPELDASGQQQGFIGAAVEPPSLPETMNRSLRYDPFTAIPRALKETWDNCVFVVVSVKKMFLGLISLKNLSGPITVAQVAAQTVSHGLEYYLNFLAVLSVSIGIFNLLPIPVLDGGHLLYYGMEAVLRKPVPRKIQEWGLQVGLLLVAGFMFLALYNDVSRLL